MELPFRIGDPDSVEDSEDRYATEEEAEAAALNLSAADSVIAVWYDGDEDEEAGITALVYHWVVYRP